MNETCCILSCDNGTVNRPFQCNESVRMRIKEDIQTGSLLLCETHYNKYEKFYAWNQKKCCDPFGKHKKKKTTTTLTRIDLSMAKELDLIPGNQICAKCLADKKKEDEDFISIQPSPSVSVQLSSQSSVTTAELVSPDVRAQLNETLGTLFIIHPTFQKFLFKIFN